MTNDGNGGNDIDPHLISPRINKPPPLFPLPENNDITVPMPMTPSEFKNRLLFGTFPSPSSSATTSISDPLLPPPESNFFARKPKSTHQGFHGSKTAPAMAVALFLVYLSLGVLIYWLNRDSYVVNPTHPVVDALYFCIQTMCTIGYGDITPNSSVTKLFSILFVLVGFIFMYILFSGVVTYVHDLQEKYMLQAALLDTLDEMEKVRIRLKVGLALGAVVLCVGFGVLIMHFVEKIGWLDSFYFSVMSVTTVGYGGGGLVFNTLPGRLLAAIWLLVSTLAMVGAFVYLAEARVDKRNRERTKQVLGENMPISQFFAADIDCNGSLSIAELVIHKLKMMEKITDKDIIPIVKQFDKLDRNNDGEITLLDLSGTSNNDLSTSTSF